MKADYSCSIWSGIKEELVPKVLGLKQGCHHVSMTVQTLVAAKRARLKNQNQRLFLALCSTLPSHSVTFTHLI